MGYDILHTQIVYRIKKDNGPRQEADEAALEAFKRDLHDLIEGDADYERIVVDVLGGI